MYVLRASEGESDLEHSQPFQFKADLKLLGENKLMEINAEN